MNDDLYPSVTVQATGNDMHRPQYDEAIVISSGGGNLSDDEVHITAAYGWFNAAELIAAIERMRVEKPE